MQHSLLHKPASKRLQFAPPTTPQYNWFFKLGRLHLRFRLHPSSFSGFIQSPIKVTILKTHNLPSQQSNVSKSRLLHTYKYKWWFLELFHIRHVHFGDYHHHQSSHPQPGSQFHQTDIGIAPVQTVAEISGLALFGIASDLASPIWRLSIISIHPSTPLSITI